MSTLYRYALSCALVVVATIARLLFLESLGTSVAFVTFYPAVALAALFGGFRCGLFATAISAVAASYFWFDPLGRFNLSIPQIVTLPVFLLGGGLISYLTFAKDRTKHLREDLRGDREKLQIFVEHAPAALAMFDSEMRYVCVSQRWIRDFKLENHDLIGLSHYDAFPDLPEKWKEAHRRGIAGETLSGQADPFPRADGSVQWKNWEIRPWRQADGSVGGIIVFSEDITQRKQHEDQLKELTQRLTHHIDNSPLAVIEWGPDISVIRWAGAAEHMFGWKPEEVLGKKLEEFRWVYEDDVTHVSNVVRALIDGSAPVTFSANRNHHKNGSVVFCEWYMSSLHDDSGHLRSILSLVLDVTERECLQRALLQHAEMLELKVKERTEELVENSRLLLRQNRLAAMGEMINSIAHQWRQPLNVLGLHIQNLPYTNLDASGMDKFIKNCMKIIQHMSKTIDDFRDFFKPEKEMIDFCIDSCVQQAVDLVESGFREKSITITTSMHDAPLANGFPNQFAQALLCILQNSRDALVAREIKGGRVAVCSFVEGPHAVVTVADNAGGIPHDIIEKIFEPYFSTKGVLGSGIGLYMTKTIVERMGGKLSVRNTAEGAEFRILLDSIDPRQPSACTVPPFHTTSASSASGDLP